MVKGAARRSVVGLVTAGAFAVPSLFGGSAAATAPATSTTTSTPARAATPAFVRLQARLEHQLAGRTAELARLSADVRGASSLDPADASTLEVRLSAETASIAGLAGEVPSDTTTAQLRAARATMYVKNRVYAVMMPQVLEAIEASGVTAQVATMQASEQALGQSVTALAGQATYRQALRTYEAFVAETARAAVLSAGVTARVMGQVPADFPGDHGLFVRASRQLLAAAVDVARASYDESLLGLEAGGGAS